MAKIKFFQGPAGSVTLEAPFKPVIRQGNFIIATDTYTYTTNKEGETPIEMNTLRFFYDVSDEERREIPNFETIKQYLLNDQEFFTYITEVIAETTGIEGIIARLTAIEAAYVKAIAAGNAITITTDEDGVKTIAVKVSTDENNKIETGTDGGLYVAPTIVTPYVGDGTAIVIDGNNEVSLKINAGDKVLSKDGDGLKSTVNVVKLATPTEGFASSYQVQGKGGVALGATIDITKDKMIKDVEFIHNATQADVDLAETRLGAGQTVVVLGGSYIAFDFYVNEIHDKWLYIDVTTLIDEYTAGNGIAITGNKISVVIDPTSENFLSISENGVKLSGVQNAIDNAISGTLSGVTINDVAATVTNRIAALTLNGSHIALTGYTKAATAAPVAATDTVNVAIGKLEKSIENANTASVEDVKVDGNTVVDINKIANIPLGSSTQSGTLKIQNVLGTSIADTISQNVAKNIDDQFLILDFNGDPIL